MEYLRETDPVALSAMRAAANKAESLKVDDHKALSRMIRNEIAQMLK